jgi:hypothetical protein
MVCADAGRIAPQHTKIKKTVDKSRMNHLPMFNQSNPTVTCPHGHSLNSHSRAPTWLVDRILVIPSRAATFIRENPHALSNDVTAPA